MYCGLAFVFPWEVNDPIIRDGIDGHSLLREEKKEFAAS